MHCSRAELWCYPTGLRHLGRNAAIAARKQKSLDASLKGWSLGYEPYLVHDAVMPVLEVRHQRQHRKDKQVAVAVLVAAAAIPEGFPLHQRSNGVQGPPGISNSLQQRILIGRNRLSVAKREEDLCHQSGKCGAVLALITCEEGLMTTRPLLQ